MGNYLEKFRAIKEKITFIRPWQPKEVSSRDSFHDFLLRIQDKHPEIAGFKHIKGRGISLTKLGYLNGYGSVNTDEIVELDSNDFNKEIGWIDVMDVNLQKYMDYIKKDELSSFFVTALGDYIGLAKELKENIIREDIASLFHENSGYDEKLGKPWYVAALARKAQGVSDDSQKLLRESSQKSPEG